MIATRWINGVGSFELTSRPVRDAVLINAAQCRDLIKWIQGGARPAIADVKLPTVEIPVGDCMTSRYQKQIVVDRLTDAMLDNEFLFLTAGPQSVNNSVLVYLEDIDDG